MPQFSKIECFVVPLRLALVALGALFVAACIPTLSDDDDGDVLVPPAIAYGEPVLDSTGGHATLNVISTGGAVARFVALPELPGHATLDTLTGRIEYEMPDGTPAWETYLVVAVGFGGMDTAEVEIPVMDTLTGPGPGPEPSLSLLVMSIALKSTTSGGLAKPSALSLSKLVITLTSSVAADSVLRDTVLASEAMGAGFSPVASQDQSIMMSYILKPLRSWTVDVKTIDVNGVVLHQGSASVNNVLVGETRAVTLNLTNRYQPHAAKFSFPDSIASAVSSVKQVLHVTRLVMQVDGDTVRDTTAVPHFAPSVIHALSWDYIPADSSHLVTLSVHADSFGSSSSAQPVYKGNFLITSTGSTQVLSLPWTGPGTGVAALSATYGPVTAVVINPPNPNPLPRRPAGQ